MMVRDSAKYLGVEISNDLSFDKHIDTIKKKGMKTLGFLRRNFPANTKRLKNVF